VLTIQRNDTEYSAYCVGFWAGFVAYPEVEGVFHRGEDVVSIMEGEGRACYRLPYRFVPKEATSREGVALGITVDHFRRNGRFIDVISGSVTVRSRIPQGRAGTGRFDKETGLVLKTEEELSKSDTRVFNRTSLTYVGPMSRSAPYRRGQRYDYDTRRAVSAIHTPSTVMNFAVQPQSRRVYAAQASGQAGALRGLTSTQLAAVSAVLGEAQAGIDAAQEQVREVRELLRGLSARPPGR
jgi:hypothetical protein